MFCKNCGKEITDDSKFCEYCGLPVAVESPIQENTTTYETTSQLKVEEASPSSPVDEIAGKVTSKKNGRRPAGIDLGLKGSILVILAGLISGISGHFYYVESEYITSSILDIIGAIAEIVIWVLAIGSLDKIDNLAPGFKLTTYICIIGWLLSSCLGLVDIADDIALLISIPMIGFTIAQLIIVCKSYKGALLWYFIAELFICIVIVLAPENLSHHNAETLAVSTIIPYYFLFRAIHGE